MRQYPAGVMIARGDLAVECGYERMAEVQVQQSRFQVGIRLCTRYSGACVDREARGLVGKSAARLQKKAARLLDVSAYAAGLRGTMKISAALKPQFPIAGECSRIPRGIFSRMLKNAANLK